MLTCNQCLACVVIKVHKASSTVAAPSMCTTTEASIEVPAETTRITNPSILHIRPTSNQTRVLMGHQHVRMVRKPNEFAHGKENSYIEPRSDDRLRLLFISIDITL